MARLASLAVLVDLQTRKSMTTLRFARCACGFEDSKANGHISLCLWVLRFESIASLAVLRGLRIRRFMGIARFARCACEDSRIDRHSSLCSLRLWICGFESQWAQLASLAVLVNFRFRVSMGTARFVRCACGFEDSKVNGHSSLAVLVALEVDSHS